MTDLENPTNEPNSSNLPDPANPSSPSKPATASPARWVIAAAAGLAVALFAMPWLRGGTSPDSTAASAGDPERSAICVSKTGAAKLNFTLKDMNGASVHLADFKGRVILLNYWATSRSPISSRCRTSTRTRASSCSACRRTTTPRHCGRSPARSR
jgi:hypothetical protein